MEWDAVAHLVGVGQMYCFKLWPEGALEWETFPLPTKLNSSAAKELK